MSFMQLEPKPEAKEEEKADDKKDAKADAKKDTDASDCSGDPKSCGSPDCATDD